MSEFENATAIVTGATRGIGRAIALELGRRGCHVAFNYAHSAEQAAGLLSELKRTGVEALSFQADVADLQQVKKMVEAVKEKFEKIDFLVNNAGITRDRPLYAMTEEDWDRVIETNLKGAFNICRSVILGMMKAKRGKILNISSISGITGLPGQVNYSASKAGLIGLTKALAKETAKLHITVNCLALGFIETDMTAGLQAAQREQILAMIPAGRAGTVEEVAEVAAFMLSDASRYITGQVLQVDGGLAM